MGAALLQGKKRAKAPVDVKAGEAPPPPPTTWDEPYMGKTAESTGVLAILKMIKEDIERDEAKADAEEAKAVEAYGKLTADLTNEKSDREQSVNEMELSVAGKEGEYTDTESSR